MMALSMASELLDREFDRLEEPRRRSLISSIHRGAIWMHELVENVLYSAALKEGQLRVHPQPLDLRSAVEETRTLVEPLLSEKNQRLNIRADRMLPLVLGDPQRISQVLVNLLSNAHKYADPGSAIDVVLQVRRGRVRVSVSDKGPGIAADVKRTMFRAYDRAGRVDGRGLGIGLWVVRQIVSAHGGRVGVMNRPTGGTTFWFNLPVMTGNVSAERETETTNAMTERVG
jgi:signal transduction histidine kinase